MELKTGNFHWGRKFIGLKTLFIGNFASEMVQKPFWLN